jgi:transketolase
MRGHIMDALFERMKTDKKLFFLTADVGINLVERFAEAYPERFLNVGIAEQNLIGVSAGLFNAGYRPVAYTISNFLIHRCFEQLRDDIAAHRYPITLLGSTAGFDNVALGYTHHIIDDWGAVAGIPGFDIYCPWSVDFSATLIDRIMDAGNPAYVRIPKGSPKELAGDATIVYLPAQRPRTLLATYGSITANCLEVAAKHDDVSALVFNRLRPIEWAAIEEAMTAHGEVIVVEDHFPDQGLYGTLCRLLMEHGVYPRVRSLAPRDYTFTIGTSNRFFEKQFGIDPDSIEAALPERSLLRV